MSNDEPRLLVPLGDMLNRKKLTPTPGRKFQLTLRPTGKLPLMQAISRA